MTNSSDAFETLRLEQSCQFPTSAPTDQPGGRHHRPLRRMVRLVHLRPAGRDLRLTDLPQPLPLRLPHRGPAHLRDRVRRTTRSAASSSPRSPTATAAELVLTLSISGMALGSLDHRPHPRLRHDRLRGTDPLRVRPHPAGHLGRQRTAKCHLLHGRTRPTEQERPVRVLLQHGQRPRHPRRDRFGCDRHLNLWRRTSSPPGVGASPS